MKFIKYLLFLGLGLVLLFLLFGIMKPTIEYGHQITVDKPAKEAWAVHQDESKLDQWLKGFKSIELIEGERGKVGSKYKVIVKPGPEEPDFEMIETIKALDPNKGINLSFDSEVMQFEQKTTFDESGGKTTIKTNSVVKGKNIMMRSIFSLMDTFTGTFQVQEEENINNLKKVINQNTTDYFPVLLPTTEENTETPNDQM